MNLQRTRQGLSNGSGQFVNLYLGAVSRSSSHNSQMIQAIKKQSKHPIESDTPVDLPPEKMMRYAVENQEAPLFSAIAPNLFPNNFKPHLEESWIQLRKKISDEMPIVEIIRFLKLKTEDLSELSSQFKGDHLFLLGQARLRDIFNLVVPGISLQQKRNIERVIMNVLDRPNHSEKSISALLETLALMDFKSEAIQLRLLDLWIEKFSQPDLLLAELESQQPVERMGLFAQNFLQLAIYKQLQMMSSYSEAHAERLYWRLVSHPEVLRFILNTKARLSPKFTSYLINVLTELVEGRLPKGDYGLALSVSTYLHKFDLADSLVERSLELLATAKGIYPYIKQDAGKILKQIRQGASKSK